MNIRVLTQPLQEKAEKELNEKPHQLEENLQLFKNWLSKQQHLKYKNDDQHLINFLRGSKSSIQRAKDKIDGYYTFKTLAPEIMQNVDPHEPIFQKYLKRGSSLILPTPREEPAAPRTIIFRSPDYDPDELTFINMLKGGLMTFNILFESDDNYVIAGMKLVWDLEGVQLKTAFQVTPILIKKIVFFLEKALPIRLKGFYVINVPPFFEHILNMGKRLLSTKLAERVHFYSTNSLEAIYEVIPKSSFPMEYGGEAGYIMDIVADWAKTIDAHRERLIHDDIYRSDESKRPEGLTSSLDINGVEGSFRKLEID